MLTHHECNFVAYGSHRYRTFFYALLHCTPFTCFKKGESIMAMTITEFASELIDTLKTTFPDFFKHASFSVQTVPKPGNVVLTGITIKFHDSNVARAIRSRHQIAPLQMKRALHMASDVDAYARLVFYVAIGWSSLPFSG